MDRISSPTAALNLFGAGKHGFTDGDPLGGVDPTFLNAQWFNGAQENPIRVIEAAGIALDAANHLQLLQALKRLSGSNITSLSANTALGADAAGIVLMSAAGGDRVLTLPPAASAGGLPLWLHIIRADSSGNALNLARAGSDTINGLTANCPLPVGAAVTLLSDGVGAWWLIGSTGLSQLDYIDASTTVFAPWWARWVKRARVWGGGGGGGIGASGSATPPFGGTGGGAGGYAEGSYRCTPGQAFVVTIGVGGAPQSAGGTTSFGALCSATGGAGGSNITVTSALAVVGGIGSGGAVNLRGGSGGLPIANPSSVTAAIGGRGGTASGGGGAGGVESYSAPEPGLFPGGGGGGGGGTGSVSGGVGAPGLAIAEWGA